MAFVRLWKVALHFGAMSGLLSFLGFLLIYFSGNSPFGKLSWLGAWIPVLFIVLATRYFRDHLSDGNIKYVEALRIGINTVFAASFLFALLVYIFGTVIDAGIVAQYKAEALEEFSKAEEFYGDEFMDNYMGENATNQAIENIEETTLYRITFADFSTKMLGGFLVTLITSWIFSRKKKNL